MTDTNEQFELDLETPAEVREAENQFNAIAKAAWDRSQFTEAELPYWVDLINLLKDNETPAAEFLLKPKLKYGAAEHRIFRKKLASQPTIKSVRRLLRELIHEYGQDLDKTDALLKVLRKVVIKGRQEEIWTIEPTPASSYVPREKNRFTPARFKLIGLYPQWQNQLKKALAIQQLTPKEALGRILLSAIVNGGLLSSHLLSALYKKLTQPNSLQLLNQQSYIRISAAWLGHEDAEVRNWYPDVITEALILKFTPFKETELQASTQQAVATRFIFGCIKAVLCRAGVKSNQQPRNMTQLLDSTALHLELRLPPFICQYLMRKHLSHSTRATALARLANNAPLSDKDTHDLQGLDLSSWQKKAGMPQQHTSQETTQVHSIARLAQADLVKDKQAFQKQLEEEISKVSWRYTIEYALLLWAKHLLIYGHENSSALAISTIAQYLTSIGSRLVEYLGNQVIAQLTAEELEEVYTQILDAIESRGLKIKVARTLYYFQHYLENKLHLEPIDINGVLGIQSAPAPVDANIIWVDEFKLLLKNLESAQLERIHPDLLIIIKLLAILGYRCGLRRSEALKLRVIDIQGESQPELLIRPHEKRRLKTASSQRRLPLKLLLDEEELELLLDWRKKRLDYLEDQIEDLGNGYLFAIPEKNYEFVPEDLVFPAIHKAMRQATQDPTVRYHHFRHSFASLTLMRLMVADQGLPEGFFEQRPKTQEWLKQGSAMKAALYPEAGPTRKHLHYIAAFLGHSSPKISLEHYIHLMDIVSSHLIKKHLVPDTEMLLLAADAPNPTVYKWIEKGQQEYIEKLRWRHRESHPELNPLAQNKQRKHSQSLNEALDTDGYKSIYKELIRLKNIIYSHKLHRMSIEQLSRRSGFSEEFIEKVVNKSNHLVTLKSALKLLRHPRKPKQYIGCPAEIQKQADQIMAEELTEKMQVYYQENPEEFKQWLEVWLANTRKDKQWVVFKEQDSGEAKAIAFIETLLAMKLPKEQIRLTLLHGKQAPKSLINKSLRHWKEKVGKGNQLRWDTQSIHNGKKLDEHGRLGINLINKETGMVSEAARFVMLMWVLWMSG